MNYDVTIHNVIMSLHHVMMLRDSQNPDHFPFPQARITQPVSHVEKPPMMLYQCWHNITGTHDILATLAKYHGYP